MVPSNSQWQTYKNIINKAATSFNKETLIWRRYVRGFDRWGEDKATSKVYTDIELLCLIAYNAFRTWPMTDESPSGALDKENIVVMLNKQYLDDLGYLNSDGYIDMDPGEDIFVHMGITYRSAGETPVSQAGDDPLHFYLILKREETDTGSDKY